MDPVEQDYSAGKKLIAGWITTDQVTVAADTYYIGMRLEYQADGVATADAGNTGDGTVTSVVAEQIASGDYVLTCTAAVTNGGVFKLEDPDGNIIASGLEMDAGAGAATTFKVAGMTFTITDGATDFAAGDFFTIEIEAAGEYVALADGKLAAIYNAQDEEVYSASGKADCIMAGEIFIEGLKTDADAAVTLTEAEIASYRNQGFYIKRK